MSVGPPEKLGYWFLVARPGEKHQVDRMIAQFGYHNQLFAFHVHFVGAAARPMLASVIDHWQTIAGGAGTDRLGAD